MHDCMSTDTVKHEEVQVDPGWSRKERHSATEAGQSMHVSLEQRLSAQSIMCDKQIAMALQLMLKASGRRKLSSQEMLEAGQSWLCATHLFKTAAAMALLVKCAHLPAKGDGERVGVLGHNELRHVAQRGAGLDSCL